MVNTVYLFSFVEAPRINLLLQSFRSVSSDRLRIIISTDEDPSLRIESSAIINLRGASTKLK